MVKNKTHLIMAVWGRKYVDLFLEISLPSQLASENLPSISTYKGSIYKIYTRKEDTLQIKSHAAFIRLQELIETQIITIDTSEGNDKFDSLMSIHNRAIMEADIENASIIFLSPDFVFANGSIHKIFKLRDRGIRAILILTLRLVQEKASDIFQKEYYSDSDNSIDIPPKELSKIALEHLHPIEKSYFWEKGKSNFPIHAYWPVENEGLLARCYYLHPIFIHPLKKFIIPQITIDADYVEKVCPIYSDIHIVRDSDEIMIVELTKESISDVNSDTRKPFTKNAYNYAKWAVVNANPYFQSIFHHRYFQVPIFVHSQSISKKWDHTIKKSKKLAEKIWWLTFFLRKHQTLRDIFYFFKWGVKRSFGSIFKIIYSIDISSHTKKYDWGPTEEGNIGNVYTWIGNSGRSTLVLPVKRRQLVNVLNTKIHTALGEGLYNLSLEINGRPVSYQQIVRKKNGFWHQAIIPLEKNSKKDTYSEITYCLDRKSDSDQIGLISATCYPIILNPVLLVSFMRSKISQWFLKKDKGITNFLDTIIKIDFGKYENMANWGEIEKGETKYRWLGEEGTSKVVFKKKNNFVGVLRTRIHTALGNSLYKLNVEVNGKPALNQHIVRHGNAFWHTCIIPDGKEKKSLNEITYRLNKENDEDKIALISLKYYPIFFNIVELIKFLFKKSSADKTVL